MKIYLAAPINGCTDDELVQILNPAERDYRGSEDENYQQLVDADKADIDQADIVIAHCWKPSVGTSMEILYAWERGKTVIVIVPAGKPVSPWLRAHSHAVIEGARLDGSQDG